MPSAISKLVGPFLNGLFSKDKAIAAKINEIIDALNAVNDGTSEFDTINEKTTNNGVLVDGVRMKDGNVLGASGTLSPL